MIENADHERIYFAEKVRVFDQIDSMINKLENIKKTQEAYRNRKDQKYNWLAEDEAVDLIAAYKQIKILIPDYPDKFSLFKEQIEDLNKRLSLLEKNSK